MSRILKAFIFTIALAAIAVAVLIVPTYPIELSGVRSWAGVVALMALAVAGEEFGIRYSSGKVVFSVSLIPTVATVPLFGPAVAVVFTFIAQLIARILLKQPLLKSIFNISQFTLAIGFGSVVYVALGGPVNHEELDILRTIVPLCGLIVAYFFTNTSLVSFVIALDTGRRWKDIARQLGPVAFASDLASSSFSLFVIFAFAELGVVGLLMVLLPLLFVHHSYSVYFKLHEQNKEILELLVKTIEAKDPYTSGHSMRVASLSRELATALGVSAKKVEEIETAALLHDIGKIDFAYAELISSPAQLSDIERQVIQSHPQRGARLLASISSLSESVLSAVRHHHEHYDGNGYPEGLAGGEIPLAARIIMVVDTVDAMLSNRPYRAALTPDQVTRELRRFSGRQFDPVVVAKFIELGLVSRASRRAEMDRTPLPLAAGKVSAPIPAH